MSGGGAENVCEHCCDHIDMHAPYVTMRDGHASVAHHYHVKCFVEKYRYLIDCECFTDPTREE